MNDPRPKKPANPPETVAFAAAQGSLATSASITEPALDREQFQETGPSGPKTSRRGSGESTWPLVLLTLLPLAIVVMQLTFELNGVLGYSLYKFFLLIPPLLYCRSHGISVMADVLRPRNWRNSLPLALGLGTVFAVIFLCAYFLAADWLVDRSLLVERIGSQFSVTATTVAIIAPLTIFLNSLLEEFFYRGFSFGLLVKKQTVLERKSHSCSVCDVVLRGETQRHDRYSKVRLALAYSLPAAAFTAQHLLFINQWLSLPLLLLAAASLFTFSLILEFLYKQADTIAAPWLAHILADMAMMTIAATLLW